MSKGKPRHNPNKPANKYGRHCPYYEEYIDGSTACEALLPGNVLKCGGNRHNCVKVSYHTLAILKNNPTKRIINCRLWPK